MHAASGGALTVDNLGDSEVHDSGDGSDGLVLCQVEGAHGKVPGVVVGYREGHVYAGHLVDLAWIWQCQVVLHTSAKADSPLMLRQQ